MSKRELSHNEEEKLPGNNPIKKVKGSPHQDISTNNSLSPSKQRQTQTTNFFRKNSVPNKPSQDSEDELETTITTEKHSKIPEIVLDSDSDCSYYRYPDPFLHLSMIFLVKMKKMKLTPLPPKK